MLIRILSFAVHLHNIVVMSLKYHISSPEGIITTSVDHARGRYIPWCIKINVQVLCKINPLLVLSENYTCQQC